MGIRAVQQLRTACLPLGGTPRDGRDETDGQREDLGKVCTIRRPNIAPQTPLNKAPGDPPNPFKQSTWRPEGLTLGGDMFGRWIVLVGEMPHIISDGLQGAK